MVSRISPMALDTASTERRAAFGSQCFSLAKSCSIGFRSGEYFGREEQPGTHRAYETADCLAAMAAEVVDDDDVVGVQRRQQHLLDIEPEPFAVDRPIDQPWRIDTIDPQRGEEGHRLPAPMWHFGLQPLAARRPAPQRCHVGLGPGLINEDPTRRVDPVAIAQPLCATAWHIRPILFAGDQRLFL